MKEVKKSTTKASQNKTITKKSAPKTTSTKKTTQTKSAPKTTATKKTTQVKPKTKVVNAIQNIINPKNNDNVVLFNQNNEAIEFEQIALIPYNENLYCILKPTEPIEKIESDEAIAFCIKEENNDIFLDIVEDDETIDAVFDAYYKLFEEAQNLKKNK